jgi:ribonuclease BN (tRNA processing enzyme)
LYLTHISNRYDPAAVAEEAGRFYPNPVVVNDFDRAGVGPVRCSPTADPAL